jgi:type III restriction enzyme
MKLVLKDFQQEAVDHMYGQVADARKSAAAGKLQVATLSAPTGSGKTVILTRLIELILEGDEEHSPDAHARFLWLTDQPELNTQTRDKMRATSDVLLWSRTVEIGPDFDMEVFAPGTVYFLNTQKLGVNSSWVKKSDVRNFTLWDTIRNTVQAEPGRFFVVIDEAHRGTKLDAQKNEEANSIMQKFVLGSDEIPPAPLLIGISATLDRFNELLSAAAKAKKSRTHHRVDIDPADVIESGLLKRKVVLEHPEQNLGAQFPLLRAGVRAWLDLQNRWAAYCANQKEAQTVRPILLIQVEDGTKTKISNTDLTAVIHAVQDESGTLPLTAFAHSFSGEGIPAVVLQDGTTTIRYLAPSAIDADQDVKVVLFKTSLNTGWDCPRAEVMVSFRAAKDATYIAQLVGRMVRAPLARRIEEDEVLNSVSLVLPEFDQSELKKVIERLTDKSGDVPPTTIEDSRERFILQQSEGLKVCFEAVKGLPSYIIPRRKVLGEVQRLGALADALTQSGLRANAGTEAREKLVDALEHEYSTRKALDAYKRIVTEEGTIPVRPVVLDYGIGTYEATDVREVPVSEEMIAELYEWARKRLGLDLGLRYWKRRADGDKSENHTITKLELYALASDPDVIARLRGEAESLVASWLNEYKPKIGKLPEAERLAFDEVKQQVQKPVMDFVDLDSRLTLDWSAPIDAPRWKRHLYEDGKGDVPEKLNSWETAVLNEEIGRDDFVGWLRNRERQPWALCIPYEAGGVWKGCYPDFIVFRKNNGDTIADIVDPHLISLEDAPRKAAALAKYADEHQDRLGRVDLIIVDRLGGEERIKRLRLMDDNTRQKVLGVTTSQHLRDLFEFKS